MGELVILGLTRCRTGGAYGITWDLALRLLKVEEEVGKKEKSRGRRSMNRMTDMGSSSGSGADRRASSVRKNGIFGKRSTGAEKAQIYTRIAPIIAAVQKAN